MNVYLSMMARMAGITAEEGFGKVRFLTKPCLEVFLRKSPEYKWEIMSNELVVLVDFYTLC